jgi:DMSO/TMAO reductase YedYZ heme-binding membrane subunit
MQQSGAISGSRPVQARKNTTNLIIIGAAIAAFGAPLLLAPAGLAGIDYYGYALRVTARVSMTFFLLAYVARPAVQVLGSGRWLVRHRRYLGLAAALAHTVHFAYVVAYDRVTETPADMATWVLGGAGFGFFWLMALTSNDLAVRRLGRAWRWLHRAGMHYIWVVFFYTFLGAAIAAGGWYWCFPLALLAGLLLRIAAWIRRRRRTSVAAAQAA